MAGGDGPENALATARGRFVTGLSRKASELETCVSALATDPSADEPREELRRRLHTLYASALVFRSEKLAAAVKRGVDRLDAARDTAQPVAAEDIESLFKLVRMLPALDAARARSAQSSTSLEPVTIPSATEPEKPLEPPSPNTRPSGFPAAPASAARTSVLPSASMAGAPLLQRVIHVLLLERAERLAATRQMLSVDVFRCTALDDPERALADARQHAPDVIVVDRELAETASVIARLRSDPMTDFVPIVLLQSGQQALDPVAVRDFGADASLTRPFEATQLAELVGRVTGTLLDPSSPLALGGDATLGELADRIADEVRAGIVDSAVSGKELRIPLGQGAEVLAAAWAAVARLRAFVAQQSGGRVRFRDVAHRGGPAVLALVDGKEPLSLTAGDESLEGRRVLVVDDDPSVVWFFAGLLREAGANVVESGDGADALQQARTKRPDLVISDVLMPELDGFALCRELKRDPLLCDVPVVLISWKEDLLHRMRELSAGAAGYLRKEAAATQILSQVREVLRPRAQLEAQLRAGGEVRGSLEGTGVVALLRSTAKVRSNARVTLRDAWSLFEAELREGRLSALTRTASDGAFSRGDAALGALLGVSAGRFSVQDSDAVSRAQFADDLDTTLQRGAFELGAIVDSVSGASLLAAQTIELDPDAFALVKAHSPGPVQNWIERIQRGDSPSDVLYSAGVSAQTLEAVLIDLARRGAIRSVRGSDGRDLIELARQARRSTESPKTDAKSDKAAKASARQPSSKPPIDGNATPPREPRHSLDDAVSLEVPAAQERISFEAATEHLADAGGGEDAATAISLRPAVRGAAASAASAGATPSAKEPERVEAPRSQSSAANIPTERPPPGFDATAREERQTSRSRGTLVAWLAAVVGLGAFGFLAERAMEAPNASEGARAFGRQRGEAGEKPAVVPAPSPAAAREADAGAEASAKPFDAGVSADATPLVPLDSVGVVMHDTWLDSNVPVAEGQGLLVVEPSDAPSGTQVFVDDRPVGSLPARLALPPGVHRIAFKRQEQVRYRYVTVETGHTSVLEKL